jgi:ketosteroid isomerase-like protein
MTMRRFVLAAFALTALAACQPAVTELTEEQKAEIAAEVDSVMSVWYSIWAGSLDFDRLATFVTDEPETGWVNDGQVLFTRAETDAAMRPFFASLQSQTATTTKSQTIVLAHDMAYTVRANVVTRVYTSGDEERDIQFAETILWVKRDGEWKILTGHGSTAPESM